MPLTSVPRLDELIAAPERVRELPPEVARDLLVKLAGLQAALLARALVPSHTEETQNGDRLLTIPETAARLNVPVAYAYELARRGEIPVTRVGRKYLRVSPSGLANWLAEKGLDNRISAAYSPIRRRGKHDRRRAAPDPSTAGPDASATGRTPRSPLEQRGPVGAE
jgi:excisionase family DNA binding protein